MVTCPRQLTSFHNFLCLYPGKLGLFNFISQEVVTQCQLSGFIHAASPPGHIAMVT